MRTYEPPSAIVRSYIFDIVITDLRPQELEARLANPAYRCGTELGGLWRGNCRWPFTCCNKNRPTWAQDEHGSRRKSPRSPPGGGADGKDKAADAPTPKRRKTTA